MPPDVNRTSQSPLRDPRHPPKPTPATSKSPSPVRPGKASTPVALNNLEEFATLYTTLTTLDPPLPHIANSLATLDAALRLYTPANLCVAFNGGKDATVILHLTLASFAHYLAATTTKLPPPATPAQLHCLYLIGEPGDNFPEVTAFVYDTLASIPSLSPSNLHLRIQDGITHFTRERPTSLCAFVMGTRRTDPHGATLERFEPSSPDWPPFMRINPILEWRYADIWHFLRTFDVPFCDLYRLGHVVVDDDSNEREEYDPAWMLVHDVLERAGRK